MNITDFDKIDRMTIWEFEMLMKAHRLKDVDDTYKMYLSAFADRAAKATKGNKYRYRSVDKLFDYDKEIRKIMEEGKNEPSTTLLRMIEYERMKEDGGAV